MAATVKYVEGKHIAAYVRSKDFPQWRPCSLLYALEIIGAMLMEPELCENIAIAIRRCEPDGTTHTDIVA
jgi:hypothetical protein